MPLTLLRRLPPAALSSSTDSALHERYSRDWSVVSGRVRNMKIYSIILYFIYLFYFLIFSSFFVFVFVFAAHTESTCNGAHQRLAASSFFATFFSITQLLPFSLFFIAIFFFFVYFFLFLVCATVCGTE